MIIYSQNITKQNKKQKQNKSFTFSLYFYMSRLLVQGCCTKLRQNPLLATSFGASTLFVWTVSLNGLTVPVGSIEYRLKHELAYRGLVGKTEGKRALEKPRYRWEDNIKMDL